MIEVDLLNSKTLRENAIKYIEVLERVKKLFLIPIMEVLTLEQIAEYYEIDTETVKQCYKRHKDEFTQDGAKLTTKKDLQKLKNTFLLNEYKTYSEYIINDYFISIPNRGIITCPVRAILRFSLLLKKSEIAKKIREQLLIYNSTIQNKNCYINEEELINKMGKSIIQGELSQIVEAFGNVVQFKNIYITQMEEENSNLILTNKALTEGILEWSDRSNVNKIIRQIAYQSGINVAFVWNKFYDELLYKQGINLKTRGERPFVQHIKKCEWKKVQNSLFALAEKYHCNIDDLKNI